MVPVVSPFFLIVVARVETQSCVHARQEFYHWAVSSSPSEEIHSLLALNPMQVQSHALSKGTPSSCFLEVLLHDKHSDFHWLILYLLPLHRSGH